MHQYIYIKIYILRAFQILKYLVALIFIRVHSPLFLGHFSTATFSHWVSRSWSRQQKLCERDGVNGIGDSHNLSTNGDLEHRMMDSYAERRICQLQLYEVYSGFCSTSLLFGLCRQVRIFIWQCF